MTIKKRAFRTLATVILLGTIGAAALYWRLASAKSVADPDGVATENVWNSVLCRGQLYLQKAEGEVSDISWAELWGLTLPGRGYHCIEGSSLESSLQFSTDASDEDRRQGARIFHDRCSVCHGLDGSGTPFAPSLTRPQYNHGDSDLAIYKVLRDGVPGTGMQSTGLTLLQRLQVISHLKSLQTQQSEENKPQASRLAIHVSAERLLAAGTNPDDWLMYSGSYNGWRHTPLAQITPASIAQLSIRWVKQFDISDANIEATPLVIDGTIFTTDGP